MARKHDPRKRLRRSLRGATLTFDGNDRNDIIMRQPNGLPVTAEMADVLTGWAWRWRITLGIRCRFGDLVSEPSIEFDTEQACRINDLTEYVEQQHQIMIMEQPAAWVTEAKTWKVECLG